MKTICGLFALVLVGYGASQCSSQENRPLFVPSIYWNEQSEKGVILSAPKEMTPVDLKGIKYPKIIVGEPVVNISMAPDGNNILYITATALWIVSIESQISRKIYSGLCDAPRWSKDSAGFTFTTYEEKTDGAGKKVAIKLFWADGDGKNLKQVYP